MMKWFYDVEMREDGTPFLIVSCYLGAYKYWGSVNLYEFHTERMISGINSIENLKSSLLRRIEDDENF